MNKNVFSILVLYKRICHEYALKIYSSKTLPLKQKEINFHPLNVYLSPSFLLSNMEHKTNNYCFSNIELQLQFWFKEKTKLNFVQADLDVNSHC